MKYNKITMPAAKKSETVTAPVVAPVEAGKKAAGAATAAGKKKETVVAAPAITPAAKASTTKAVAAAPVVPATPAAAAPVDAGAAAPKENADTIIADLLEKVASLMAQIKPIQASLKQLSKEYDKQRKIIEKVQKKKEKAKKSPSGFAKPCKISDELCDFIGVAKGSEQSRTDITRFINSYVKQHNLNNPDNRREFFPDKKLKTILNVKDGEKVTYFVLQRLIAHHFPPSMTKLAAAAAATAAAK
jgi:ATP-dependent Lon protease